MEQIKETLELTNDGLGIARQSYTDQHGSTWLETDTRGYMDENPCDECGEDYGWTLCCMDGGEAYCEDCLNKLFDVKYL